MCKTSSLILILCWVLMPGADGEQTRSRPSPMPRAEDSRPAKVSQKPAPKDDAGTRRRSNGSVKSDRLPRRCAGLLPDHKQCSRVAVEPTDYCKDHANQRRK
jgi:hypothetical protein